MQKSIPTISRKANAHPPATLKGTMLKVVLFPFALHTFWIKWRSSIGMAIRSLWLHKMRVFLSVLGIIIGTAAVISLMAFGEGSMQDALDDIRRQGATNIIVRSEKPPDTANQTQQSFFVKYGLTFEDYERFQRLPTVIRHVPMRIFRQQIRHLDRMVLGRVVGTTAEYKEVTQFQMAAGRFIVDADDFIAEGDDQNFRNVCVLGANVAASLFPFESPIGKSIHINSNNYVVVGVIADRAAVKGSSDGSGGEDFNYDVYIPLSTNFNRFGSKIYLRQSGSRSGEIVELHQITLTVADMSPKTIYGTADVIRSMLSYHHDKKDWSIYIPRDQLEAAERTKDRFLLLLTLIASISLLVGGIGIMNIMLATVTERIREIGIRRALGAKRKDIILQFLVEAVMQTGIGGILGIIVGLLLVFGLPIVVPIVWEFFWPGQSKPLPAVLSLWSIYLSFGAAVVVGVIFGLYPAWRASRLDPIEALRHM